MDDTTTTQVTGEQRTRSGAASLFSAAHGYPSLRSESGDAPTGVERAGSGRSLSKTREWKAAYMREWRAKNKARYWKSRKRYEAAHPDVKKARDKRYRDRNTAKVRKAVSRWFAAHPERVRELRKQTMKRVRGELRDSYIRGMIARHSKNITTKDIPESFVAAVRDYLKLKRLCQESRTSTNSDKTSSTPMNR